MAGDTKLFQEALKRGSAHAWNEQWDKAAEEYRRALREFPEDISARTYLAMALYKAGSHRESLQLYQALWNSQPSNLTMLQRVAELQEAIGERDAAAMSYGRLAEAHARRRAPKEAFKAWQKIVEFTPGNPLLWNSLVQAAVQAGTVREVIPGYVGLARELALQSRFQDAIQIAERAQALDPENPLVMPMLAAIRKGIEYSLRAASFGEEVYPEDLARYVPSVEVLQSRIDAQPLPSSSLIEVTSEALVAEQLLREYEARQTAKSVTAGQQVFQVLFRPSAESAEQGPTIDSVRSNLSRLGNVVQVRPEVEGEGKGAVVFVILVASALDAESIRRAMFASWPSVSTSQAQTAGPMVGQPAIEVRQVPPGEDVAPAPALTEPPTEPEIPVAETEIALIPAEMTSAEEATPSEEATPPQEAAPSEEATPVETVTPVEEVSVTAEEPAEEAEAAGEAEVEHMAPPGAELELPPLEVEPEPESIELIEPEASGASAEGIAPVAEMVDASNERSEQEFAVQIPDLSSVEPELLPEEESPVTPETTFVDEGTVDDHGPNERIEAVGEEVEPSAANTLADITAVEPDVETVISESAGVEPEEESADSDAEPAQATEEVVETVPADEPEPQPEVEAGPVWEVLLREAEVARLSGSIVEAVDLYEQAIAAGANTAQHLVELGELHERLGREENATRAFKQALELSPNMSPALLGLSRLDFRAHRLDAAENVAREAFRGALPDYPEAEAWAADLLLDILHERAAYGDLGATLDGITWLQSVAAVDRLPESIIERMYAAPRELLGQSVSEHLKELASLPNYLRGEVATALWKAERLIEEGKLRSASDEMFKLISANPDFLPAQSLLRRILMAQGKLNEASVLARRLIDLYELRGKESEATEVLLWMVHTGIAAGDDWQRLIRLLGNQGRHSEAEALMSEKEAEERAELERIAAEEAARRAAEEAAMRAAEEVRRAAEEAAQRAAEEAAKRAAEEAARRVAAEEAVMRALDELSRKAEEEEALTQRQAEMEAAVARAEAEALEARRVAEQAQTEPPVPGARLSEAEPTKKEDSKPKRGGIFGIFGALRGKKESPEEKPEQAAPAEVQLSTDAAARDALLRLAESKFAFGDGKGAAALIRSALQDQRISSDVATRVALLRTLQLTDPSEESLHGTLEGILETLGLPEELAN